MAYQDGYSGQLAKVDLRNVLQRLAAERQSGVLSVAHPRFPTTLWIKNGDLVDAQSGSLSGLAAAYRALSLSEGDLSYRDAPVERARLISDSLMAILLRHHCLASNWAALEGDVPSLYNLYRARHGHPELLRADPTPTERKFLEALDGTRTVVEALEKSEGDAAKLLPLLARWVSQGIVEIPSVSSLPPPATARPSRADAPMRIVEAGVSLAPMRQRSNTLVGMPAIKSPPVDVAPTLSKDDQGPTTNRGLQREQLRSSAPPLLADDELPPTGPETDRGVAPQAPLSVAPRRQFRVSGVHAPIATDRPPERADSNGAGSAPRADERVAAPAPEATESPKPPAVIQDSERAAAATASPKSPVATDSSPPAADDASAAPLAVSPSAPPGSSAPSVALSPTLIGVQPASTVVQDARSSSSIPPQRTVVVAPVQAPAAGSGASDNATAATFGRYRVVSRLGRGGMGTVYRATLMGESGFSRPVAIKVLRDQYSNSDSALQLLMKEARIASRLQHRNVVSVIDVGTEKGQPYLVMDYVRGHSLAALLKETPREATPERIVSIVLDCLAGLDAIHNLTDERGQKLGVVHNDISPENILVGTDGTARVADLGVASLHRDRNGVILGKPGHISPERIRGGKYDHRSDIFAVGIVLWSALTGREPFPGNDPNDIMRKVLSTTLPKPSTVGNRPPAELDAICLKALARDPYARYHSAEDMLIDLRRVAVSCDILAPPSSVSAWVELLAVESYETPRPASAGTAAGARAASEPPPAGASDPDAEPAPTTLRRRAISTPGPTDTQRLHTLGETSRRVRILQAAAALAAVGILVFVALRPDALPGQDDDTWDQRPRRGVQAGRDEPSMDEPHASSPPADEPTKPGNSPPVATSPTSSQPSEKKPKVAPVATPQDNGPSAATASSTAVKVPRVTAVPATGGAASSN